MIDDVTLNPEVGIAPIPELLDEAEIFGPDVETADIPDLPVDDDELAVVSVVQFEVDDSERRWKEDADLTVMGDQFFKIGVRKLRDPTASYNRRTLTPALARST